MADEGAGARPLTAGEIAAVRERAEAATPGPWRIMDGIGFYGLMAPFDRGPHDEIDLGSVQYRPNGTADGAFIAAAREDIPRLLATLDAWRPVLEAVAKEPGNLVMGHGWVCQHCDALLKRADLLDMLLRFEQPHAPDCPVSMARRLLGMEGGDDGD